MLENKYREQIAKLDCMIANWEILARKFEVQTIGVHQFDGYHGLCLNAKLWSIDNDIQRDIYKKWSQYSGNEAFPIEGSQNQYHNQINKFQDERRLSLAKHIRTELFILGTPKPPLRQTAEILINETKLGFIAMFIIVLLFGFICGSYF